MKFSYLEAYNKMKIFPNLLLMTPYDKTQK